jgi:ribosomal protein L29
MATFEDKNKTELEDLLEQKRESLRETRFNISGASDTTPQETRQTRKDVARILTELRERQLTDKES